MGIRIHKMMGYGLTDVKTRGFRFHDGRFNRKGILRVDWEDREVLWTLAGYADWLDEKKATLGEDEYSEAWDCSWERNAVRQIMAGASKQLQLWECFIHQIEYGMSEVVCCIPLQCRNSWYRYDDSLDYHEETYARSGQKNWVKVLKDGFYPYNGLYWDARDGRVIKPDHACFLRRTANAAREKGGFENELDAISKACGFESFSDASEHMVPVVPPGLRFLLEYCKVFTDPSVVFQLRPMIYVYWG